MQKTFADCCVIAELSMGWVGLVVGRKKALFADRGV